MGSFSDSWSLFSISGDPEPGFDYSWLLVQRGLDFIGYDGAVRNCTLFFASRQPGTYLVQPPSHPGVIWNATKCWFAPLGDSRSILVVTLSNRCFHLSGVTQAFVSLLGRLRKLPLDPPMARLSVEPIPVLVKRVGSPSQLPVEATTIVIKRKHGPVIVTGPGIETQLKGIPIVSGGDSDGTISLRGIDSWGLSFEDIASVEGTLVGKYYLMIRTKGDKRFDIAYDEPDIKDGQALKQRLANFLMRREVF
jgi:hypothetical protein